MELCELIRSRQGFVSLLDPPSSGNAPRLSVKDLNDAWRYTLTRELPSVHNSELRAKHKSACVAISNLQLVMSGLLMILRYLCVRLLMMFRLLVYTSAAALAVGSSQQQ